METDILSKEGKPGIAGIEPVSVVPGGSAELLGGQAGGVSVNAPADGISTETAFRFAKLVHVLSGPSIIDSSFPQFPSRKDVDDFVRLCGFDTDNPLENQKLDELRVEAVGYLSEVHNLQMPEEVSAINDLRELFWTRDGTYLAAEARSYACMLLKVMHIFYRMSARELVCNAHVSEADLFNRLSSRFFHMIDLMRAEKINVLEYVAGKKKRYSLATKLLAKRDTLATHIFDRVRFRLVLDTRHDLVRCLEFLFGKLIPFNSVMPGQSINGILSDLDILDYLDSSTRQASDLKEAMPLKHRNAPNPQNNFSGSGYRSINFVAEIPLRIDDLVRDASPAIAVVQTEIQLLDKGTEQRNSEGSSAHYLYKRRQTEFVRKRLLAKDHPSEI